MPGKGNEGFELITATEALEEYRVFMAFLKWDKRMLASLCKGSILVSKYNSTLREWVIERKSLERLMAYMQELMGEASGRAGAGNGP